MKFHECKNKKNERKSKYNNNSYFHSYQTRSSKRTLNSHKYHPLAKNIHPGTKLKVLMSAIRWTQWGNFFDDTNLSDGKFKNFKMRLNSFYFMRHYFSYVSDKKMCRKIWSHKCFYILAKTRTDYCYDFLTLHT